MKKTLVITLALAALLLYGSPGTADAGPASATGTASARVAAPLDMVKIRDLEFGTLSGDGMITVHGDGTAVTLAGNTRVVGNPVPERGRIRVDGIPGRTVVAMVAPTTLTLTGTQRASPSAMTANIYIGMEPLGTTTFLLNSKGEAMVFIGGKLTILPTTPTDQYKGTFTVTAYYQ